MNKAFKYFSLVICLIFLVIFSIFQSKNLKQSGSYDLASLDADVSVHFDRFGIPHIEGKNAADTYRALGFLVASERLFQMDLFRRLVSGRLSEIFGEKTIQADIMLRKLRLKHTAQEYLTSSRERLNPEVFKQIEAFLEGVHQYIDNQSLPVEFDLLGYRPDKFEVADILGLTYYMAMTFAEGITGDVFMSELMEKLPADKMEIIRIGAKVDEDYFPQQKIVQTQTKSQFLEQFHNSLKEIKEYLPIFHGSNSWVLAPERTKNNKPILANDPHIGVGNPHIFYEAHIKYPGFELYGHFIPLSPFPALGHTPHSAWGMTMSELDDLTVYLEQFHPEDPNQVRFKNEWVAVAKTTEKIIVKDGRDRSVDVIVTPHGPLIDGTSFGVEGKSLSLSWSIYHPQNDVLQSLFELPRARTVEEFRTAVSHAAAPGLNISWVSESGDIAWWVMGKFPKLPDGVDYDLVLKGWDGKSEIERYFSIDENPHDINPQSGVIVTANYKPQYSQFDHFDGYWQPGGRYFRIEQLLKQQQVWSVAELKKIQTDNIVPEYSQIKSQVMLGMELNKLSEYEKEALEYFKNWDGATSEDSVGASIYHMLTYQMSYNIFIDELGDKGFKTFSKIADFWSAFKKLLYNQQHSFWDNIHTDHVESGKHIITASYQEAISKLKQRLGVQVSRWHWGRLHRSKYTHPLGKVKPLNHIYNIGPIPAPGGRYVINNLGHKRSTDDFTVVHAPATRRIVDMSNPQESYGVIPTGNSGNPFSKHFSDQLKLYHRGEYRLQDMNWERIKSRPLLLLKSGK